MLSAKTPGALTELAGRYEAWLACLAGGVGLADMCFTASVGRGQLSHRAAIVAGDAGGAFGGSGGGAVGRGACGGSAGAPAGRCRGLRCCSPVRAASGLGWRTGLYRAEPVFRATLGAMLRGGGRAGGLESAVAGRFCWRRLGRRLAGLLMRRRIRSRRCMRCRRAVGAVAFVGSGGVGGAWSQRRRVRGGVCGGGA